MIIDLGNFGPNSCNHGDMCEMVAVGTDMIDVPLRYDGYFVDVVAEKHEIEKNGKRYLRYRVGKQELSPWDNLVSLFCQIKEEMYSMTVWYDAIKEFTIPATFVGMNDKVDQQGPFFAKLDTVSAKDIHPSGIYQTVSQIKQIFQRSPRIQADLQQRKYIEPCIVIRPVIRMDVELRCFVYQNTLTAVSSTQQHFVMTPEQHQDIDNFFKALLPKLPYGEAVVDIFITDGCIKVIEINDFGGYSNTCAGKYNWRDDSLILYNASCPSFDFR